MTLEWITTATTALLSLIDSMGYLGIFILMAIESSFIPLPSEAVMIPAGALAAQNQMNIIFAFVAGVLGNIVGALICYWLAYVIGRRGIESLNKKYGKFFLLSPNAVEKVDVYFEKHGHITIFLARLVPGIRHLISIPAGFSKMNIFEFTTYTALGSALWCTVLLWLGFVLGKNSALIAQDLKMITIAVTVIGGAIALIYWIWQKYNTKQTTGRRKH